MGSHRSAAGLRPTTYPPRATLAAVVLIAAAAFAVRAAYLTNYALTHWDEGAIWLSAKWFVTGGAEGAYRSTTSPPLVPIMFGVFAWTFGLVAGAAVWLSVLAGTASVVVMFLIGRRLASVRAGLLSAGLLAMSGMHVMYSRFLLTEPFYILFLLLALLFTLEYLRAPARWALLGAAVSAGSLQLTKYNGCLAAVPLLAILAYRVVTGTNAERRRAVRHGVVLAGVVVATIGATIAGLYVVGELQPFVRHFANYVGGEPASPLQLLKYLHLATPFPLALLAAAGLAVTLRFHRSESWLVVHISLLLYLAFTLSYTFYLRLLAPLVALLIVYAGFLLDRLAGVRSKAVRIPALLIAAAIVVDTWRDLPRYLTRDFGGYPEASRWLNATSPRDPVFLVAQRFVWPELTRPAVSVLSPRPHDLIPHDAEHAYVVKDLYAHYKYRDRVFLRLLEPFEDRIAVRISNPLAYDVVENNLTLAELALFERDASFRAEILSIVIYRLTRAEAAAVLTRDEP